MPSSSFQLKRTGKVVLSLALLPFIVVCSSDKSTAITPAPGDVSDLNVASVASTSATLAFTQVDDGTGSPASYELRYSVGPMQWGSANAVGSGTCSSPVTGTQIGAQLTCSILGLTPSTAYNFQVVAFRGTLNTDAVFGSQSNVASASTPSSGPPPQTVSSVTIAPSTPSVSAGSTTTLVATVKDGNGNVMSGQTVSWSSSNTSTATVNGNGVVSGLAAGTATITATCASVSGTATVTVTTAPPPTPVVTTVSVAPSTPSINAGATVTLTATVKDQNGNVMTGQAVTWSSSSTSVATVNGSGVVSGVAAGSATITATCAGKSGTATVTVNVAPVVTTVTVSPATPSINVGATVTLTASVKDQNGNVMTGQTITWSTSNSAVATVNASGVVSAVAAGTATITATCSAKSGSATVTVNAAPPPGGGTLLFEEDFENTNISSRGWYDNTTAQLSTTEHITGSTASAQYHFTAGASSPTSGGSQRHKFTPTSSVYVSFYVKYSANWVGSGQAYHPHEFYILSTLDGDYDGPSNNFLDVYIEHNYQNGGRPRFAMQDNKSINTSMGTPPNNLIGTTENRSTGGCNGVIETNIFSECYDAGSNWYNDKQLTGPVTFQPNPGPGYKNDWNFVEAYFQLNTIANGVTQADGVMQYWFNGTLIIDRHDIVFRTSYRPTLQFTQFIIAPYIGDGSPVDQYMWVDNLRVATGRIP